MTAFPVLDRHKKIAFSFSGGKDSTLILHMLRDRLDQITVYHLDSGDLLPEMVDHVARSVEGLPHYVRIETHVLDWQRENGLPTDLLPYSSHPVGVITGEPGTRLVSRYVCCYTNLMLPLFERVLADGNTLLIRGTKASDMRTLPAVSGEVSEGIELFYPLQGWSDEQVFVALSLRDITLPPLYDHFNSAPECARCSAWWGEGRAAFLKAHYPDLFADYDERLQLIIDELAPALLALKHEAGVA